MTEATGLRGFNFGELEVFGNWLGVEGTNNQALAFILGDRDSALRTAQDTSFRLELFSEVSTYCKEKFNYGRVVFNDFFEI